MDLHTGIQNPKIGERGLRVRKTPVPNPEKSVFSQGLGSLKAHLIELLMFMLSANQVHGMVAHVCAIFRNIATGVLINERQIMHLFEESPPDLVNIFLSN